MADASLPDMRARSSSGAAIAAVMPTIATTISSSMIVKPCSLRSFISRSVGASRVVVECRRSVRQSYYRSLYRTIRDLRTFLVSLTATQMSSTDCACWRNGGPRRARSNEGRTTPLSSKRFAPDCANAETVQRYRSFVSLCACVCRESPPRREGFRAEEPLRRSGQRRQLADGLKHPELIELLEVLDDDPLHQPRDHQSRHGDVAAARRNAGELAAMRAARGEARRHSIALGDLQIDRHDDVRKRAAI